MRIHAIGGYNEVGKNMTAVEIGSDVIVFDNGLFLPAIVGVAEREKIPTEKGMRALGALPDDLYLDRNNLRENVRAILISHAHLDHVGGVPYIAPRYAADVVGTHFTIEVLKVLMADSHQRIHNRLVAVAPDSVYLVRGKRSYKAEFVTMTHSTIQSAMIALHTPEGIVLYANDYKLDNSPVFGSKPNYRRIKELARIGVKALIVDCLYASDDRKTPSEKIAKGLLEDVFFSTDNRSGGMIVTTFSSHIARLKTISELGHQLHREVVFIGRSLGKYMTAAANIDQAPFRRNIQLLSYKKQIEHVLKRINKNKRRYLVVCTGHQGEPGSILDRISRHQLPLTISAEDQVIFSSKTIPTPINEANRSALEQRLRKSHARIFDNVHVSILPDTQVMFNGPEGVKLREISVITEQDKKGLKVPAFDPQDLKIKWYNASLVEHPYKGKIFNIKTKSGRSVSITSGHSLFKLYKGKVVYEKGDYLKVGDYLAIPHRFKWYKEKNEINVEDFLSLENKHFSKKDDVLYFDSIPITPLRIALTKEFARLLGYYLAEGSAPRHLSLVISRDEKDLLEDIKRCIASCFPSNIHVAERGNACEITFGARTLRDLFKSWFGEDARTKKIPSFVFSASNECKLNFLGAYLSGDGYIDKGTDHFRIRVKTASKKLASDLLYLFSQVGICAKFDHVYRQEPRFIAGSNKQTPATEAYVIRIQGVEYLKLIKDFLSEKIKKQIEERIPGWKFSQNYPPEALPLEHINLEDIEPQKGTYLHDVKYYREKSKKKRNSFSRNLLLNQSKDIWGDMKKILESDLLFDPIVEIKETDYEGKVYDFSVPEAENFIGGFGGIMLHNSGHGGREDLRDLIKLTKPEHVIPSHGDYAKLMAGATLAQESGYVMDRTIHVLANGQAVTL